jgi:hypothetical protein
VMNPDIVWYLGCPVAVAGMAVVGVRAGRGRRVVPDGEVEPTLVLAAAPGDRGDVLAAGAGAPARGRFRAGARAVVRGLRGKVVTLVRRGAQAPSRAAGADESGQHEAAASVLGAQGPGDRAAGVPEPVPDVVGAEQFVTVGEGPDQRVAGPRTISYGVGIVEVPQDEEEAEAGAAGGLGWAAGVTSRESALARTLAQRDEEAARAKQREAEAQALAAQHELERIAVAERARVQAQARLRLWFVRLDDQLDMPTTAQRCALIGTLGIRAAWAGKLLRTAYEQEQEPSVRARIVGALAAGGHFAVSEPFEEAARRGGVERAAVWEALQPRQNEADWIPALLASLLDGVAAA